MVLHPVNIIEVAITVEVEVEVETEVIIGVVDEVSLEADLYRQTINNRKVVPRLNHSKNQRWLSHCYATTAKSQIISNDTA